MYLFLIRHIYVCYVAEHTFVSFVATCQIRTVWSFEQLAISSPQGLTLAIRTHSLCPVNVLTQ